MGTIKIYSSGSFAPVFSHWSRALKHGHTAAIMDAVSFLMGSPLRAAVAQDATLRSRGVSPQEGFDKSVAEWLDIFDKSGSLPDVKQEIALPPVEVPSGND